MSAVAHAYDLATLAGVPLRRLVTDSRLVKRGDTFLAYPG